MTTNPYDSAVEVAHIRKGNIISDVAFAARDYYRPLTAQELADLTSEVGEILVAADREEIWLTANEVITLCAIHSHS